VFYGTGGGPLEAAEEDFAESCLPAVRSAGGGLLGLFRPDVGWPRPGLVAFFTWPDLSSETHRAMMPTRRLVPRTSFLLRPQDYAMPAANLGQ
jgi:hypothetical protein